ncbi:MAG TPA: hypothetical protein VMJ90_07500, partial [Anaerolineales bacterium]|nr:hypothetical protein [Anaerolineales bacterium]
RQEPISSPMKPAAREPEREPEPEPVSRARAIFNASEEPKPFNPSEFDFAMLEEGSDALAMQAAEARRTGASSESRSRGRRILGMTPVQLAILAALALCLVCILVVGFAYVIPAVS